MYTQSVTFIIQRMINEIHEIHFTCAICSWNAYWTRRRWNTKRALYIILCKEPYICVCPFNCKLQLINAIRNIIWTTHTGRKTPIECLIAAVRFLQKSPIISAYFVGTDLQNMVSYKSSPSCITLQMRIQWYSTHKHSNHFNPISEAHFFFSRL